jgi:hypothetical protein
MNNSTTKKRQRRRYNVPVIAHFADRSIRFNSILEAEAFTGISYTLIFEACIGKIYKARNVYWEFENGTHYIKYKAHYIKAKLRLQEEGTDHGHSKLHKLEAKAAH